MKSALAALLLALVPGLARSAEITRYATRVTVDPDGPVCVCGNRGCLETVFSARAIEGEAWAAVHRGCASALTRLFREQPQLATCRTIVVKKHGGTIRFDTETGKGSTFVIRLPLEADPTP